MTFKHNKTTWLRYFFDNAPTMLPIYFSLFLQTTYLLLMTYFRFHYRPRYFFLPAFCTFNARCIISHTSRNRAAATILPPFLPFLPDIYDFGFDFHFTFSDDALRHSGCTGASLMISILDISRNAYFYFQHFASSAQINGLLTERHQLTRLPRGL